MTTLRERINDVAFWDGFICLRCGYSEYDDRMVTEGDTCPLCEQHSFVRATTVQGVMKETDETDD